MHLLLLSATDLEISETATWLNNHAIGLNALKPKLLIGGIGQLQTAYALQNRIRLERPGLVIQAGIGGAPAIDEIGKVYAIGSEQIADLGVMEKTGFTNIFDMGLENRDRFHSATEDWTIPTGPCWNGPGCRFWMVKRSMGSCHLMLTAFNEIPSGLLKVWKEPLCIMYA